MTTQVHGRALLTIPEAAERLSVSVPRCVAWSLVPEAPQPEPEFYKPAPPIPDEEAVVCVSPFLMISTGQKVVRGQRLHRDDPLVVANPEAFAIVTPLQGSTGVRVHVSLLSRNGLRPAFKSAMTDSRAATAGESSPSRSRAVAT
jgi:hypothetical protein